MKDVRLKKSHSACFQLHDFLQKQNCKDREQISNLQRLCRREGLTTKWKKVKLLSHVQFLVTLWTVTHQAPLSMGFSRQEYWSGFPFPPLRDFPDPGIKLRCPTLQADCLPSEPPGNPLTIKGMREFWVVMKLFHISVTGVVVKMFQFVKMLKTLF